MGKRNSFLSVLSPALRDRRAVYAPIVRLLPQLSTSTKTTAREGGLGHSLYAAAETFGKVHAADAMQRTTNLLLHLAIQELLHTFSTSRRPRVWISFVLELSDARWSNELVMVGGLM